MDKRNKTHLRQKGKHTLKSAKYAEDDKSLLVIIEE
jgi:hypothetical protein